MPREMRSGQKIKNRGVQPAGSKGWPNEKITRIQIPGGDQDLIDESSSSDDEISDKDNKPPTDEEEDMDNIPTSPIRSDRKL